nr:uncharacterized protein LOC116939248 isoform X2 [Petromyzon marinus]
MQSSIFRAFEGKELSRLRRCFPFLRKSQLRARLRLAWRAHKATLEALSTGSRKLNGSAIKNTSPVVAQAFLKLDERACGKESLATSTCTNTAMNTPFSFEEDENNVPVIDLATRVKRAMRNHDEVSSENEKIGTANFENGKFTRKFHNSRMKMDAGLHTMDMNADVSNLMKSQPGEMQKSKPVCIVNEGAGQMYSERHLKKQSILITRSPKVTRKHIEIKTQYYNQLFQEDSKICDETSNDDESNSMPFHNEIQTGKDKKQNISEQDEVCEATQGDSRLGQVARHCGDVTEDEDFKRETSQGRKNQWYQKDTILQATEMIPGGFFEKQMRCTERDHTQAPWDTCETLIGPNQDRCNYFLHGQCTETCSADDSNMDIDSQSSNFSTTDSDSHMEDVWEADKENQGLEEIKEIKGHMDDWVPWENETHEVEHDVQWQKLDEGKNEWRILIDLFSDYKSVHTATATSAYESEEEQTEENPGALDFLWDVAETT